MAREATKLQRDRKGSGHGRVKGSDGRRKRSKGGTSSSGSEANFDNCQFNGDATAPGDYRGQRFAARGSVTNRACSLSPKYPVDFSEEEHFRRRNSRHHSSYMDIDGESEENGSGENEEEGEEDDKLLQQIPNTPEIQAYRRGAWWDVIVLQNLGNGIYRIRYKNRKPWPLTPDDVDQLPMKALRLRPRSVDDWDCGLLRKDMDVSVHADHPEALLSPRQALYDGRIVNVEKSRHVHDCMCCFTVQLYRIKRSAPGKGKQKLERDRERDPELGLLERDVMMDSEPLRFKIPELHILQKPCVTPFHELLRAHIAQNFVMADSRQSNDAFFLNEVYTHGNGEKAASTCLGVSFHSEEEDPHRDLGRSRAGAGAGAGEKRKGEDKCKSQKKTRGCDFQPSRDSNAVASRTRTSTRGDSPTGGEGRNLKHKANGGKGGSGCDTGDDDSVRAISFSPGERQRMDAKKRERDRQRAREGKRDREAERQRALDNNAAAGVAAALAAGVPKTPSPKSTTKTSPSGSAPERQECPSPTPAQKKSSSIPLKGPVTISEDSVSLSSRGVNSTDSSDDSDWSLGRPRLRSANRTKKASQQSTEEKRGRERERDPPERCSFIRPLTDDLFVNNSINDMSEGDNQENAGAGAGGSGGMPINAEAKQKADVNESTWKPTMSDESDSGTSNSDDDDGEINPLAAQVIARRQEMAAAERNGSSGERMFAEFGVPDHYSPSDNTDDESQGGESPKCDHAKTILNETIGMVCEKCGICIEPIEQMIPEVVWYPSRARETDAEEFDFNTSFPDGQQCMNTYKQDEEAKCGAPEEVNMLSTSLPPHYAEQMHAHQREGYEFLWRNLTVGKGASRRRRVDKFSGCILSHAPGTGKSFLIVAFLMSFMDKFPGVRPLIVVPKIMLMRWEKEFKRWKANIRVLILNSEEQGKRLSAKHEKLVYERFQNHPMTAKQTVDIGRLAMVYEWKHERSALLVSYKLFTKLTDYEGPISARRAPECSQDVGRALLTLPGVLILDEGHFPRNQNTQVRKALMRVEAKSRILLSGTLFQNNFEELFNTLYLVRPGFVEAFSSLEPAEGFSDHISAEDIESQAQTQGGVLRGGARRRLAMEEATQAAEKKARKLFVDEVGKKIEDGQLCKDSEILQHGLQRLHRLTMEFVHHHTGEVLNSLPGLRDFGILIQPTPLQRVLLDVLEKVFEQPEDYLKREIAVSEAGIHPHLVNKLDFIDPSTLLKYSARGTLSQSEWGIMDKEPNFEDGVKTKFVFDLLRSLEPTDEKLLIFSQHLQPLSMLERMFKAVLQWDMGKHVLRLDGQMPMVARDEVIDKFNEVKSSVRVLLASTKACGEGINLIGASRVVFLDVLWNPAVIKQAVSRAFRLGQQKPVYAYRLITLETFEEKKYKTAILKDWLSMSITKPSDARADQSDEEAAEDSPRKNPDVDLDHSSTAAAEEEVLVWQVDADTCEDGILEKLLRDDMSNAMSYVRILEHGSKFHHRKTACGPNAKEYFVGKSKNLGDNIASKICDDFDHEPEACNSDEEI